MSANVPPVLTTDARVAWLQPKRDKLRDQILALEKCLEGKVTVEELKDLDVYLNVTNDNCTSEQSMERMEAEIAKLEERETIYARMLENRKHTLLLETYHKIQLWQARQGV